MAYLQLLYYMYIIYDIYIWYGFIFTVGMPKKVTNAKIACLDFSLQKAKMKMGVQVLVEDPEKLDAIRQR